MPGRKRSVVDIRLEIAGEHVVCQQDGVPALSTPLSRFLAALVERADYEALPDAIPEGVRFIHRRGEITVLVIEERPQMRTVRWVTDDSPAPFGPGATFRPATLAFPFVVLVIALRGGATTGYQQCFYRTAPLQTREDTLLYPNLLNVAPGAYGQDAWFCLAGLPTALAPLSWEGKVRALRTHLWGAAFTRSAEIHEGTSCWQLMREVDPRVASLAAWEATSQKDPFFALTVPWRALDRRMGQVVAAMLDALAPAPSPATAVDLVSLLSAHRDASRRKSRPGAPTR